MNTIRHKRQKRFGVKNKRVQISSQILAIIYMLLLTISFLTSYTGAYFNDVSIIYGTISAGTWQEIWDKSSLKFPNESKDQIITSSIPVEILVSILNTGSDMTGQTQYEVYYIDKGNPKNGNKIGEGVIEPIAANQMSILKYMATQPGNYKFKALQRPGHGNKYDKRQALWSETITVSPETPSLETDQITVTPSSQPNQSQTIESSEEPSNQTGEEKVKTSIETEQGNTNVLERIEENNESISPQE